MGKNKNVIKSPFSLKNMKYYFGVPHCHTAFSTGRGSPLDAFEYGRDNGLDFMIITDHNSYLTRNIYINNKEITRWTASTLISAKYAKKHDDFLPMIGFESKTAPYGDFNIINSTNFFTGVVNDLKLLVLWMLNNPDSLVTINHPHKNVKNLEFNPLLNKIITSVEVGNGSAPNKYMRHDKYYYYLLDQGWKLGAINGQDNHRMNFGDSENLTVFIANDLSIDTFVDSFRKRRTYSTESKTLEMYFTINDNFMGEEITLLDNTLRFSIFINDTKVKIKEIQILTNGGTVLKKINDLNLNSIKYLYDHTHISGETWYLIKIIQDNNKIAISSPIFIS